MRTTVEFAGIRPNDMTTTVPIFPLNTVLYPGGMLPLRIFEQRYLEMTTGLPA